MMEQGALEEVDALMKQNLSEGLPLMRAHGVPELIQHLRGTMSKEDAIAKGQQNTRNYAKRQLTWLRNQFPSAQAIENTQQLKSIFT
jgi:tRNA dimethylallyltransferase